MAENILGLLFVTSSSRGRNVFRYPPDPFSPHTRLTQPIYPSATFTASEAIRKPRYRSAFDDLEGRRSNGTSTKGSHVRLGKLAGSDTSKTRTSAQTRIDDEAIDGDDESSSDSSASSGEEPEYTWTASTRAKRPSVEAAPRRVSDGRRASDSRKASESKKQPDSKASPDGTGVVTFDTSARGSKASIPEPRPATNVTTNGSSNKDAEDHDHDHDKFIESQYNYALSYTLDFLGDMLTPPPAARNRKFEICVDELVFVGYPVSVGADGKWAMPVDDDEPEVRATARGRRREGPSHLGTVVETREGISPDTDHSPRANGEKTNEEKTKKEEDDGPPTLNMFNLVLIMDKPDPRISHESAEGIVATTLFDEVYREIVFKWTAAAYSLQVSDGYVAKEAWEMAKLRDKGINESIPIIDCCRMLYERSSLDRALNQLFAAIYQYQTRPQNPLYSSLPTTITVSLGNVPISMVLSARTAEIDEAWAHWGEIDEISDVSSEDSDVGHGEEIKIRDLRVEPWQTLLLVDEDAVEQAQEISRSLVGLGIGVEEFDDDETPISTATIVRRGSKEEEDEGHLMKNVIEACDVTKPLLEIAHILRFDLEGIVIPLARELVQNKKAILVDVMNARLRTVVMPTTISEHVLSLHEHATRFSKRFPQLPPLPQFLATISAAPVQFRELLPKDEVSNSALRQTYMDAMVWLLKQDLVVQVRIRARIFARPDVKEMAWRRLWTRRRDKWLKRRRRRKESTLSRMTDETPRANDHPVDPLDATVPPPKQMNDLEYDPDLEMDSDNDEGGETNDSAEIHGMIFTEDQTEPTNIPQFEESFIFRPSRAQKDEARWLRIIREGPDEVWASKFDLCVQYFDGIATFEEISYRTGLQKRELERILILYKDHDMLILM